MTGAIGRRPAFAAPRHPWTRDTTEVQIKKLEALLAKSARFLICRAVERRPAFAAPRHLWTRDTTEVQIKKLEALLAKAPCS